jgi:hypothetical protein
MNLPFFKKIATKGSLLSRQNRDCLHKLHVKERVSTTVAVAKLVRTLETPDEFGESDINPNHILKAVRGSGFVLDLAKTKSVNVIKGILERWRKNLIEKGFPCGFLIEEKINDAVFGITGETVDYKFFCFHGEPKFFLVRFKGNRNFYWLDWTPMKAVGQELPRVDLTEMVRVAKILSAPFEFVRIDLYNAVDGVYFGEYTFHVREGKQEFSLELEYELGKLW